MGLFGRKVVNHRCPECRYYVMLEGHGYCAKDIAPGVDAKRLSPEGVRRQCVRCPEEMTCPGWEAP
ncbi:MAG: hypothetical protein U9R48_03525 [Chloroflexota bacterium]|nr:hypothetical protein [Chloroflexota bacterium]